MQDKRVEALLQMLAGGHKGDEQKVRKNVEASLSAEQQELFKKAVSDSSVAQQLLNTPEAIELLKKLQGNGGKNGS